jgi:hypothetical protein
MRTSNGKPIDPARQRIATGKASKQTKTCPSPITLKAIQSHPRALAHTHTQHSLAKRVTLVFVHRMLSVAACSARCISCAKSSDGLWSQQLRALLYSLGCSRLTALTRLARGLRTRGTASAARSTAHSRRRRRRAIRSRRHRSVGVLTVGSPRCQRQRHCAHCGHALHRGARCLGFGRIEQRHEASARVLLYATAAAVRQPRPE